MIKVSEGQSKLDLGSEAQTERVEEYKFEPVKGYPILNWRGKRPFTSTQFYPSQLKEVHGPDVAGWRNKIFWGDNLQVMSHLLKDFRGKVDLVYIDPPFDSNADYRKTIQVRGRTATNAMSSFEEKQYSDIWNNDEYLQFMFERLLLLRELMSSAATICVHVDTKRSHYLKLIMDEIFGQDNFRAQIIWQKLRALKAQSSHYSSTHDCLLIYSKSADFVFFPQYGEKDPKMLQTHYRHVEEGTGKIYRLADFTQAGQGEPKKFGDRVLAPPAGKHWIWSQEKIDAGMANGTIVFSKNGVPNVKRYYDATEGARIGDIWSDIPPVNPMASEREGYPTQKPEALVERIVKSFSHEGDLVLDCFMGSGTAPTVAAKLGRKFIGADINLGSIQIGVKRLRSLIESHPSEASVGFEVFNVNNYDLFRNPAQAKELLLEALEVQPLDQHGCFEGEKDGRMVKIMPVNRIATKADLGELVSAFDQKLFQKRQEENPNQPVEKILLVCMGHEPDLKAELELQAKPFRIDVSVVDILRDKSHLEFKRDSEAKLTIRGEELKVESFYPMNLLQKLSLQQEQIGDWRELVESVMVDWNYDGAVLQPAIVDVPDKNNLVAGCYKVPADAGTIRVKITDLLSESWEGNIDG